MELDEWMDHKAQWWAQGLPPPRAIRAPSGPGHGLEGPSDSGLISRAAAGSRGAVSDPTPGLAGQQYF